MMFLGALIVSRQLVLKITLLRGLPNTVYWSDSAGSVGLFHLHCIGTQRGVARISRLAKTHFRVACGLNT